MKNLPSKRASRVTLAREQICQSRFMVNRMVNRLSAVRFPASATHDSRFGPTGRTFSDRIPPPTMKSENVQSDGNQVRKRPTLFGDQSYCDRHRATHGRGLSTDGCGPDDDSECKPRLPIRGTRFLKTDLEGFYDIAESVRTCIDPGDCAYASWRVGCAKAPRSRHVTNYQVFTLPNRLG